jgi:hypothetical protein
MLGDFLREAAVLVIVFYPLDQYFNAMAPGRITNPVPIRRIVQLSVLLLAGGMALERIDFGALALRGLNWAQAGITAAKRLLEREEQQ